MSAQTELVPQKETSALPLSINPSAEPNRWALILAGGDGSRLRPLTRILAGDDRPKQFCTFFGGETLLDRTRQRVSWIIPEERIAVVVTKQHRQYYEPDVLRTAPLLTIQPEDRGTGPAVLYSLLAISRRDPGAHIAVFPASHHFTNETGFLTSVDSAFRAVGRRSRLVVVLGMLPDSPAVDYSWIELSKPLPGLSEEPLFHISRFRERPTFRAAKRMFSGGWLWNSGIVISSVNALLRVLENAAPALCQSFWPTVGLLGTSSEEVALERVYREIPVVDFSKDVLSPHPEALTVLPVCNSGWTDLADETRTVTLMASTRMRFRGTSG
jgi:mannose-1-phosphate guanylyltransferase